MKMTSNKPYFIRAIYDWIVDNELTPYLLVDAEHPDVEVPLEFVNAGRIVLNISPKACRGLHLENDRILFTARFSGQTTQIFVNPMAVLAIYAKENGRGMEFGPEYNEDDTLPHKPSNAKSSTAIDSGARTAPHSKKPALRLVKQNNLDEGNLPRDEE